MAYELLTNLIFEPKGKHDPSLTYTIKDTVMSDDGSKVYFALKDVPAGIPLTDTEYWILQMDLSSSKNAMDTAAATAKTQIDAVTKSAQDRVDSMVDTAADAITNLNDYTEQYGLRVRGETHKASGNPIKIYPDAGSLFKPVTTIKVVQEGSGDPYPAGGGRNLIPFPYITGDKTENGVTFAVQDDGGIKVTGTATGVTYFNLCEVRFSDINMSTAGTFTDGNVCLSGAAGGVNIGYSPGNNRTYLFTPSSGAVDAVVYPQVEKGSTPTEYQKYSNIRPFIGYDKLDLNRAGKNLLSLPYLDGGVGDTIIKNGMTFVVNADGSVTANGTVEGSTAYFRFSNIDFGEDTIVAGGSNGIYALSYKLRYNGNTKTTSINLSVGTVCDNETFYPQIEFGTVATEYEQPQSKLHTVQIGQTVYGGKFDWLTGKLVAEWAGYAFDGTESFRQQTIPLESAACFYIALNDIDMPGSANMNVLSSHFASALAGVNGTTINAVSLNDALSNMLFNVDVDVCGGTADEWKSYLAAQYAAGTPVQIAYKLATPIEIQLTPTAVLATETEGVNYIYGDGDIEVDYVIPLKQSIAKRVDMLLDTFAEPFEQTGEIVTCEPVAGIEFDSVVTVLEPQQEGSGDPYPAGGGKNKLSFPYWDGSSFTNAGVTFNVNDDGSVSLGGSTSSEQAWFHLVRDLSLPAGDYVLSGGHSGNITIRVGKGQNGNTMIGHANPGPLKFRLDDGDAITIALRIYENTACDGVTIKPQLELGSEATDYAPPSNIRPFIGYDKLDLNRAGKNLVNSAPSQSITTSGVTFSASADGHGTNVKGTSSADWAQNPREYYDTLSLPPGTYTFSRHLVGSTNGAKVNFMIRVNGKNEGAVGSASKTYTFAEQTEIGFFVYVAESGKTVDCTVYLQLEFDSASSDFQPYTGTLHTVQIGQTVYGGKLDWLTGKLTAEWAMLTLDGTEPWSLGESMYYRAWLGLTNYETSKTAVMCSHFKGVKSNEYATNMASISGGTVTLRNDAAFGNPSTLTADDFKAYLAAQYAAGTPVQIAYKLATPIEIQLPATEIIALSGVNNLYGSGKTTVAGRQSKDVDISRRLTTLETLLTNQTKGE